MMLPMQEEVGVVHTFGCRADIGRALGTLVILCCLVRILVLPGEFSLWKCIKQYIYSVCILRRTPT